MANVIEVKYDGNGGNEKRVFIKDARVAWRFMILGEIHDFGGDLLLVIYVSY